MSRQNSQTHLNALWVGVALIQFSAEIGKLYSETGVNTVFKLIFGYFHSAIALHWVLCGQKWWSADISNWIQSLVHQFPPWRSHHVISGSDIYLTIRHISHHVIYIRFPPCHIRIRIRHISQQAVVTDHSSVTFDENIWSPCQNQPFKTKNQWSN